MDDDGGDLGGGQGLTWRTWVGDIGTPQPQDKRLGKREAVPGEDQDLLKPGQPKTLQDQSSREPQNPRLWVHVI